MPLVNNYFSLNRLGDFFEYHENLNIVDIEAIHLKNYLKSMIRIRFAERQLATGRRDKLIGGPVHLGVGQEAVAVGVSKHLKKTDRVFGAHRSHSHLLALGSSVHGLFAEVLGKDTGHSKGMGGSMHLWDQPNGFYGSVPIVAGTVPLAVGAGLAAKLQQTGDVAISYLGDGAIEEGVVQESLNLARVQNIPVIFVVENNLFASHMHISERQPTDSTARFAAANLIPYRIIDGNDVLAVSAAADELINNARLGRGPGFLEAVTFRWYGHVDWREDIDVGINRSADEMLEWRKRDPVGRLLNAMLDAKIWTIDEQKSMELDIQNEINSAWDQAMLDPYPLPEALLGRVYAHGGVL